MILDNDEMCLMLFFFLSKCGMYDFDDVFFFFLKVVIDGVFVVKILDWLLK